MKMNLSQLDLNNIDQVKSTFGIMQDELHKMNAQICELTSLLTQSTTKNDVLMAENFKMNDEMRQINAKMLQMVELHNVKSLTTSKKRSANSNATNISSKEKKFRKFEGGPIRNGQTTIENYLINNNNAIATTSSSSLSAIAASMNTNETDADENENENGNGNKNENENRKGNEWTTVTSKNCKSNSKNGRKITPIQIEQIGVAELKLLCADLTKKVPRNDMFVHQLGEKKMPRIFCENEAAKDVVIAHLRAAKIQFNSYNNNESRKKAFIVRGLICDDSDDAIEQIHDAIIEMGVSSEVEISRFETAHQRFHPSSDRVPLYRVVVAASTDDKMLLEIRTIGYCRVRVERMKKSAVIQCHRCQRFHHTTGQCNFDYRCVQCAQSHQYGSCPRLTNDNLPIVCVNCVEAKMANANHTANDLRNCGFYQKKLTDQQAQQQRGQQRQQHTTTPILVSNSNEKQQPRPSRANGGASGGINYANALKGNALSSNGVGGLSCAQLTEIITLTVKGVLAAIGNNNGY